tara:strand:- start:9 stop:845 length:837 start_codon:yes stop_codon:yes gene_type:complete
MKKLLVVGDSFSTRYLEHMRRYPNAIKLKPYVFHIKPYKYWFDYFAEDLNLEVLNLAFSGSGNQQIFDNTLYGLNTNKDIDTIMIGWSAFERIDLLRGESLDNIHLCKTQDLNNEDWFHRSYLPNAETYITMFREDGIFPVEKLINQFLNYSITLDSICKNRNIKLIQFFAVEPLTPTLYLEKIGKKMHYYKTYINNKLMNHINTNNFFGFPGTETLGGTNLHQIMVRQKNYEDLIINSEQYVFSAEHNWIHYVDSHPNGEGNKLIYETLNNFRLDIY